MRSTTTAAVALLAGALAQETVPDASSLPEGSFFIDPRTGVLYRLPGWNLAQAPVGYIDAIRQSDGVRTDFQAHGLAVIQVASALVTAVA